MKIFLLFGYFLIGLIGMPGSAIAKEIVGHHNGSVTAKSADGLIEFEVALPL